MLGLMFVFNTFFGSQHLFIVNYINDKHNYNYEHNDEGTC